MNGHTTTTLRLFFEFASMVQFRLPSSTYLDLYMTVRLLSTAIFTISWREYFCQLGQSAALTLHLANKSCQDHLGSSAPTRELRKLDLRKKREAMLARQTAEWGMRMIQTPFP